ncbi:MAG: NYN domain-containing protein [Desulfobacterales bacterium]|nr:NYN domain-containing protein [Desulfobacterales bacterium]
MNKKRTVFYIDGFNLYFGLKELGWRRYYWLNLQEISRRLTRPHQQLVRVRYFTARITGPDRKKQLRQNTYLQALETLPLVEIHYGHYLAHTRKCKKCGSSFTRYNEKRSDVNIAVNLLTDAMDDLYDTAVLISGDGDLVPAVQAIKEYFPKKRVVLFFPPKRPSAFLKNTCHVFGGTLNKHTISKSQLPETVTSKLGYPLRRPAHWT